MRRLLFFIITGTLVWLGVWQTSQGLWIYLKAELAQHLLNLAWSKTLRGEPNVKPWPWADTWPIGRLFIPQHGVDLIVLANANARTLAFAPGHESLSSLPGENGTSILSGHRDTHFRFLEWVEEGDSLIIQKPNGLTATYVIHSIDIVDAGRTKIHLDIDQKYLVLVTCFPFDAINPGGPLRYVVTAKAHKAASDHKSKTTP